MAGVKETPRQRMIAMMYLVLTALLALNVSKEVVDAFLVVNESVELTNEKFIQKLEYKYNTFETMYQLNQTEVQSFWDRAKIAKSLSSEMIQYMNDLRDGLIAEVEGISVDSAKNVLIRELKKKDNFSLTTKYFMGNSHDGSGGKSRDLKEKIIQYRQALIDLVDSTEKHKLKFGLITDGDYYNADGQKQNWEAHHFFHTILAADITILNKLISEIYDAEYEVVNMMMDEINAEDFSYDKIDAKVIPHSNFLFVGDEYRAEVIVAAYDTSQSPQVYILKDADKMTVQQIKQAVLLDRDEGKAMIRFPANRIGVNKYAGVIGVKTSSGEMNYFPFANEYVVAEPTVMVSVEEMNVLYIGVDNTVTVSVSGIPTADLIPSISFGTIQPSEYGDKWLVNVPPGESNAEISVMTKLNGLMREMGSQKFRIKRLPDPIATIANEKEGFIDREIIIAAGAIVPNMPGDFGFELYFEIISFKMTIQRGFNIYHFTANNGILTEEMIEQIEITNRGQNLLFENIIALGPYGDERSLSPIILTIN